MIQNAPTWKFAASDNRARGCSIRQREMGKVFVTYIVSKWIRLLIVKNTKINKMRSQKK